MAFAGLLPKNATVSFNRLSEYWTGPRIASADGSSPFSTIDILSAWKLHRLEADPPFFWGGRDARFHDSQTHTECPKPGDTIESGFNVFPVVAEAYRWLD